MRPRRTLSRDRRTQNNDVFHDIDLINNLSRNPSSNQSRNKQLTVDSFDCHEKRVLNFMRSLFMILFYTICFVDEYYFNVNLERKLIGFSILFSFEIFYFITCCIKNNLLKNIFIIIRQFFIHTILIAYRSYFFMTNLQFLILNGTVALLHLILIYIISIFDLENPNAFVINYTFFIIIGFYFVNLISFIYSIIYGHLYISIIIFVSFFWYTITFINAVGQNFFYNKMVILDFFITSVCLSLVLILTEIQKQFYNNNPLIIDDKYFAIDFFKSFFKQ